MHLVEITAATMLPIPVIDDGTTTITCIRSKTWKKGVLFNINANSCVRVTGTNGTGTCYWYLLLVPFILPMVGLEGIVNTSHPRHGFLIATVIRNEMKTEELGSQGGR